MPEDSNMYNDKGELSVNSQTEKKFNFRNDEQKPPGLYNSSKNEFSPQITPGKLAHIDQTTIKSSWNEEHPKTGEDGCKFNGSGQENSAKKQTEKKKPVILDDSKRRMTGRLKFFDENKNYGFVIIDSDNTDIFVHYEDLCKAGLTKDILKNAGFIKTIRVSFCSLTYIGKHNKSRKAVDLELFDDIEVIKTK